MANIDSHYRFRFICPGCGQTMYPSDIQIYQEIHQFTGRRVGVRTDNMGREIIVLDMPRIDMVFECACKRQRQVQQYWLWPDGTLRPDNIETRHKFTYVVDSPDREGQ